MGGANVESHIQNVMRQSDEVMKKCNDKFK